MTRVGADFRYHEQAPGTTLDDANVDAYALAAADLDTTVTGLGALTLQTGGAQGVDPDVSSTAFVEGVTALAVATSGKFRAMLYYAKCPTAGAGGGYRAWILRNAANDGDSVRLMVDDARKFWLTNGAGTVMAGASFLGLGANVPVRIDVSGDFSAGTARLALYTTNPETSTVPDQVDTPTGLTWVSTDFGRQRVLAPHTGELWATAPVLGYWDSDDTTDAAMAPLDVASEPSSSLGGPYAYDGSVYA